MSTERVNKRIFKAERDSISKFGLKGKSLVVAVSGGPDSMSLLDSMHKLSEKLELKLVGAHINHGVFGETDENSQFVFNQIRDRGIEAEVEYINVPKLRHNIKGSEETIARIARYRLLSEILKKHQADVVTTAHTLDDQVESILMHLTRGTSIRGLLGMKTLDNVKIHPSFEPVSIFRPLLDIEKKETLEYCDSNGLSFHQDLANENLEFTRNKFRHQVIPLLESINPQFKKAMLKLSKSAKNTKEMIDHEVRRYSFVISGKKGDYYIHQKGLDIVPTALREEILKFMIELEKGDLQKIESSHIEDILSISESKRPKKLDIPAGLKIEVRDGIIRLINEG